MQFINPVGSNEKTQEGTYGLVSKPLFILAALLCTCPHVPLNLVGSSWAPGTYSACWVLTPGLIQLKNKKNEKWSIHAQKFWKGSFIECNQIQWCCVQYLLVTIWAMQRKDIQKGINSPLLSNITYISERTRSFPLTIEWYMIKRDKNRHNFSFLFMYRSCFVVLLIAALVSSFLLMIFAAV